MRNAPTTKSNESASKRLYYIKLAALSLLKAFAALAVIYGLAQLLTIWGMV